LNEERLVETEAFTDARKISFGNAARALRQHQCRIACQADRESDKQRHRDKHEQRLQNSFDQKSGHQCASEMLQQAGYDRLAVLSFLLTRQ